MKLVDIKNTVINFRAKNIETVDGTYYIAIMNPYTLGDLQNEQANYWIEVSKYTNDKGLFEGEIGAINGCRILSNFNIEYSYIMGKKAFDIFKKEGFGSKEILKKLEEAGMVTIK